jgi:polyribonucleotide nucleotidyltransferase
VSIFAGCAAELEEASRRIQETVDGEVKVGSRYMGKVLSIKEFGAIVELVVSTP